MPEGVYGGTITSPVDGLINGTLPVVGVEVLIVTLFTDGFGTPFNLSLVRILPTVVGVVIVPVTVYSSPTVVIVGATVGVFTPTTVTVTVVGVLQLLLLARSHK